MDKECGRCERSLPVAAFGVNRARDDGLMAYCRECVHAYRRERRELERLRRPPDWKRKTADRAAYQRAWLAARPGYATARKRAWLAKPENRWRKHVKDAVRYALKTGRLQRDPCWACGTMDGLEAHHPDYLAPLAVVWLCGEHHCAVHAMV